MNEQIDKWISEHQKELISDVQALCAIPSVQGKAEEGKPFGDGPYRSLNLALEMAKKYGFATRNYENYVGTADLDPALPHTLDILGHTDVVPAGEGWTVTDPFKVIVKDGRLYGRGTSDDKGPLLAAMYAMRAVKECGVKLSKGVRLIIGANEETGSADIAHYYAQEPEAEMTFSPDAEFPLINIEKGQFRGTLYRDFPEDSNLPRLLSLDAGVAFNAVPQKAVIRLEGLDLQDASVQKAVAQTEKECGVDISISGEQELTVIGESAHASTPETGRNAGLAAVLLVTRLPLHDSEQIRALKQIPVLFPYGVTDGSGLGIRMEDEESHALTCTLDLYHVTPTHAEFVFDSRTPVMANKENCEDVAVKAIHDAGFEWSSETGMIPPHVVPGDSVFVRKLLESYERVTGKKGACLAIGGGTYVHDLKNGVAFGAVFDGVDTRMHGADEFFDIDNLMTAVRVFADAIINLCA
ncbi:MAG: Sapep family Mn(2+)-dependent dipeptidase [Eubacterium sp.]|nr:Sapep family Mn(2+)-dependent dipeptidase [Eubacterium sp.]